MAQNMTIGAQRFVVLMAVEEVDEMAKRQSTLDCKESVPQQSKMAEN